MVHYAGIVCLLTYVLHAGLEITLTTLATAGPERDATDLLFSTSSLRISHTLGYRTRGYCLAAIVIETVSDVSGAEFLDVYIFDSLFRI